jgi:hypothetical protein
MLKSGLVFASSAARLAYANSIHCAMELVHTRHNRHTWHSCHTAESGPLSGVTDHGSPVSGDRALRAMRAPPARLVVQILINRVGIGEATLKLWRQLCAQEQMARHRRESVAISVLAA